MSGKEFHNNFDTISNDLHNFALHLTKNEENAQDLYQETAYKALKNKEKFKIGTNFKAWMTTIMRNTFINEYRRKKRQQTYQAASDSYQFDSPSIAVSNVGETNVGYKELVGIVNQLDDKTRVPFWKYYLGYSYQEIADELEVPLGTIKSRIFHARRILHILIHAKYQDLTLLPIHK